MFRLRKKNPPFGTAETPLMEYAYSEQVKVVDGMCDVIHLSTKDYLLKTGYEEILDSELSGVGQSANGPQERPVEPPAQRFPSERIPSERVPSMRASSKKHEKKKRR